LWLGKNPDEQLHGYGLDGWIVLLTRDHQVHHLALALTPDLWKDRLNSPGEFDPRGTKITINDP